MLNRRIVFDLEGNNLRDECTKIHCGVIKDIDTKMIYRFWDELPDFKHENTPYVKNFPLRRLGEFFGQTTLAIGHNVIFYDFPVMERLLDIDYTGEIQDTLVYSKVLHPDRQLPKGCPTHILNPITGRKDKIGPHSLHAWGYRVGRGKPEYYNWETFTPEMLHRCEEDVEINELVYYDLLREAKL